MNTHYWSKLDKRFEQLSLRERALVFLCVTVVVLIGLGDGMLSGGLKENKRLGKQYAAAQLQIKSLQVNQQVLKQGLAQDPKAALKQQVAHMTEDIEQLENQIVNAMQKLVPPSHMAAILEDLFKKSQGLSLVSLESLAPIPINVNTLGQAPMRLYKHGIKLTFVGKYFDTLSYLKGLEDLSWGLIWEKMHYQVKKHPLAQIQLILYTLSAQEEWIGV